MTLSTQVSDTTKYTLDRVQPSNKHIVFNFDDSLMAGGCVHLATCDTSMMVNNAERPAWTQQLTICDRFEIPSRDVLYTLGGAEFFTKLKLAQGFHQLALCEEDRL